MKKIDNKTRFFDIINQIQGSYISLIDDDKTKANEISMNMDVAMSTLRAEARSFRDGEQSLTMFQISLLLLTNDETDQMLIATMGENDQIKIVSSKEIQDLNGDVILSFNQNETIDYAKKLYGILSSIRTYAFHAQNGKDVDIMILGRNLQPTVLTELDSMKQNPEKQDDKKGDGSGSQPNNS